MIIIEGTDLVGKTRLCERLIAELNERGKPVVYDHFGRLPKGWDYYWDYLGRMNRNVVMDRFTLSEVAYRYANKEPQNILPEDWRVLDAKLRLVGAVTVVVTAADSIIAREYDNRRDEEMFDLDVVLRANDAFAQLAEGVGELSKTFGQVDIDIVYRITHGGGFPSSSDFLVKDIIQHWEKRQVRHWALQDRKDNRHVPVL